MHTCINSSPPGQKGRHFADDNFKSVFMNDKFFILIRISLKFVPKTAIDNKAALVQGMAWRRTGDNPLPDWLNQCWPSSLPHICGTRGRWVNKLAIICPHTMACSLFGAKPSSKPMLFYCQLDSWDPISVKFKSKYEDFHSRKSIWNFFLSQPQCVVDQSMNQGTDHPWFRKCSIRCSGPRHQFNSLASGRCGSNFISIIFKLIL